MYDIECKKRRYRMSIRIRSLRYRMLRSISKVRHSILGCQGSRCEGVRPGSVGPRKVWGSPTALLAPQRESWGLGAAVCTAQHSPACPGIGPLADSDVRVARGGGPGRAPPNGGPWPCLHLFRWPGVHGSRLHSRWAC
jgi:hypothetical protein